MDRDRLISDRGSDRATAYNMSGKLVRHEGRLYIGWLDAPAERGGMARVTVGICDAKTGALEKTVELGEGKDNHCGPALAVGPGGRIHAIVGAHHGPFLYRWTDSADDSGEWSEPVALGPEDTYPSLAVDKEGTLHLAFREKGAFWSLQYRRKREGRAWEAPVALAESPFPGYNHFMQSLTLGPDGTLHLTFQFYYSKSGDSRDCKGKAAVHLWSEDGGDTWTNEGEVCRLPVTIETARPIAECFDAEDHSLRIGNHVVDRGGNPWLVASRADGSGGDLWHRAASGWEAIDLHAALPQVNLQAGKSATLSYDAAGRFHFLASAHPKGLESGWADPINELFYAVLSADGSPVSCEQVTADDPHVSNWLPAAEPWDWRRPEACGTDGHWYLYTAGVNAGLISQADYNSALTTKVYLGKRPEPTG